ncbi:nucleotidyltransferase domain-containing protein [Oceanobacillus jeddahense]|uniref:Nucleotidyltransferase domain-containing protein n=1 Tax=Oceanobacillus jeddahense TaxID=1462527 RepID=A0ABY5JT95_9BACI|nr:nucleotidyltransferase domain-containing protein [Oceanobacillus jeddahense]UUI03560.1 nucleotidyltransferase domain-containing protein [Oceanobacillus jeddahense]
MDILSLSSGYGIDSNGFIISDVSMDKIDSRYLPCIEETIDCLQHLFQQQLHSIYLYGSVPRGDAILLKSDLDIIAMFHSKINTQQLDRLKKLSGELTKKYQPLVRDVGIAVANYDDTFDPANYYENASLKEICVCVYGEDVGKRFGPYKLTPEIPISFNGDICEVRNRALKRMEAASDKDFKTLSQGFIRKLIRTYYSMVMVRSQIWTTRLHEQSEVVIQYFPEKSAVIDILLYWLEKPPADRDFAYELFQKEGDWACRNFEKEVEITY